MNENAFAPIVRARPCPTFGRPVCHRGRPHRLRPGTSPHALRIPPRGGHPALRSLTSSGCRSALAVSSFRLRARLDFSIPSTHSGQRGVTPAFGYDAPHPSAGGTSTLLICALPGAHYETIRPCTTHCYLHPCRSTTWTLSLASRYRFPRSMQKPRPSSRRLYAGRHCGRKQVASAAFPGCTTKNPVLTSSDHAFDTSSDGSFAFVSLVVT